MSRILIEQQQKKRKRKIRPQRDESLGFVMCAQLCTVMKSWCK